MFSQGGAPQALAKLVNITSPALVLMVINNDYIVNSAYKRLPPAN